jgi:CBS domain containing-hemolysin-like protein
MTGWLQSGLMILLFFCGSALFSGMETGGYLVNRLRLRHRARQGSRRARRLRYVLGDAHRFIFTVLIGNNIANYLLARDVTRLYQRGGLTDGGLLFGVVPWNAETAATLTLLLPLFLFGELLPKNLFRRHADRLMYGLSGLLIFFDRLFRPATALLDRFFNRMTGGTKQREALSGVSLSVQGLREVVAADQSRRILTDHQRGMIDNLVAMHRVPVRLVMQPAAKIPSIPETVTVAEARERFQQCDVEEMAAFRGSTRRITGMVSLFDLADPEMNPDAPIKPHLRKTLRLPADLSLNLAFRRMRQSGAAVAVVTDRSSRTVGLLHLRDIAGYLVEAE